MTKKNLAETYPEIAKQWHPTKNRDLKPKDVSNKSSKKIWWKCDKGDDHEWITTVYHRVYGTKCPMCSGLKASKTNCLETLFPEIAKQWHPTKNGDLTPYNILPKVSYKVWWKCDKGDDHEWEQSPFTRTRNKNNKGCPICSGNKLVSSNCLVNLRPEIAKQWHPTKNGSLTPYDFTITSRKKVWWKCNKGDDHEWETTIYSRIGGSGCLICSGHKVAPSTSIATLYPKFAKQWHPTKNGSLTPYEVGIGSIKKVWWKCDKGDDHEWNVSVNSRYTGKAGCPICSNQKIVLSNCLATLNPKLAKQWHPTKNGSLTPYDLGIKSGKKIWWKCDKGDDHKWVASINNRSQGRGCPVCAKTGFDLTKIGYLYAHLIYDSKTENKIALKFGITNNYGERIKDIRRKLDLYQIKNMFYFEGIGKEVLDVENKIKKSYKSSYLNEEIMRDGFTETIKYSDKTVVEIYNLCNKKMKFKSGNKLYIKRFLNLIFE
jgi:hypothetical protein